MAQDGLAERDPRVSRPEVAAHYLYAIVDGLPGHWRPPASGVGTTAVFARPLRDLTLLTSLLDAPLARTPKALARHHDVVATTLEAHAVLPLRFGTVVPASGIDEWVGSRLKTVRYYLAQLRGRVEMTVRLARLDVAASSTFGRALGSGARRDVPLSAIAEQLVERAEVPNWRYRPLGRDGAVASLAFLVTRDDVPSFLARIAPVASRAMGVAVVPTGPWPAFSFVEGFDDGESSAAAASGPPELAAAG